MGTFTNNDYQLLLNRCRELPPAKGNYLVKDFIENIFITVLDFQLKGDIIEKAIQFFRDNRSHEIRTFESLKNVLGNHPDNQDGNTAVAHYLWGYNYWNRVMLMRLLVDFLDSEGITDQKSLVKWANESNYKDNFQGKVPGMGYTIYQWLIMRQGIETIKPDIHVTRFVQGTIGRDDVSETDIVESLEAIANEMGLKAYELDWRIFEYDRDTKTNRDR